MTQLAVFGASGRTGRVLVDLAVSHGWDVRALVRPTAQFVPQPGVEVLHGSLENTVAVAATLSGVAAVCCVFGPRSASAPAFCARGTAQVVSAMKASGLRRVVCLTGAMVGELAPNVSLPMRLMAGVFRRRVPHFAADVAEQERIIMRSALDWTIVKPPRLADGPPTGRVRADPDLRVGLLSRIRRHDLAAFMLAEVARSEHFGQRVYVSN